MARARKQPIFMQPHINIMKPQGIFKRNPDSGVATAVSSIIEHQKFKRMLMFGLRSLSDFCSSSTQLYLENALDALDRNVVPSIHQAITNFGDDEELTQSASKILFAMSTAVTNESSTQLSDKLANDGGVSTVFLIINKISVDSETFEFCVDFLINMESYIKSHTSNFDFVSRLVEFVEKKQIPQNLLIKVVSIFNSISQIEAGIKTLESSNALNHLFKYALESADSSIELPLALFKLLKKLNTKINCDSTLEHAINLMEKFRNNKNVLERGNDAVKTLIGQEKLGQCLNTLKNGDVKSKEYKSAILTLRSLSYITGAASEIAKSGNAVLLLDLLKNALNSNDNEIKESLVCGSCYMLARLASHSECANLLFSKGLIENLSNVLVSCKDNLICVAAAAEALSKYVQLPESVDIVKNIQLFDIALPLLFENADKPEAHSLLELVHSGTLNSDFLQNIVLSNGVEIISTCCQYHLDNVNFHALAVSTLNNISSLQINLKAVSEYGGLVGISTSLVNNISNVNYALETLKVLVAFSSNADATKYMCNGDIAEACLKCMIAHHDNKKINELGTKCLEVIATEGDLQRNTLNLKDTLLKFKDMGDKPFTMLTSISGLCKIERLKSALVKGKILDIITDSIGCLIDQPIDQNLAPTKIALIKSAINTATSLNFLYSATDTARFTVFSDLSCLSNVKRLTEIDQSESDLLSNFVENMNLMVNHYRNLDEQNFLQALEAFIKIMRKYQDIRRVQIISMEAIYTLISLSDKFHSDVLNTSGLVNVVISYLQRVPMYADVQTAGLKLLLLCVKSDKSGLLLKTLIDCGSLAVIRTASRTHARNTQLKPILGALMSLLLPVDAIEHELLELLDHCQEFVNKKELPNLFSTITCVNQLLASNEAIKIALKISILSRLTPILKFAVSHKPSFKEVDGMTAKEMTDACLSELSHIYFNSCQLRVGRVAATKQDVVKDLVGLYKSLEPPINEHTTETAASTLETLSILLEHDRVNSDLSYEAGLCERLCEGIKLFVGSTIIMNATCTCLSSICTTDKKVQALIASKGFGSLAESLVSSISLEGKRDVIYNSLIALSALFKTEKPILLQFFAQKTKIIQALFSIKSNYPYDAELILAASECLKKLLPFDTGEKLDLLNRICILDNVLNSNKEDANIIGNVLEILVDLLGNDVELLKQSGVFETVSQLMNIHQDNQRINALGGKIVGIMGADELIKMIMKSIIELGSASQIAVQSIDAQASKLAIFLSSPLEDRNNALQHTEECLKVINNLLSYFASNPRLVANLSAISRRLCESAFDDPEDQYGAWAVSNSGNTSQLLNLFVTEYGLSNPAFLTNCFTVFASCLHNPYTREIMSEPCKTVLPLLDQLLRKYSGNSEFVHSLMAFLKELKLIGIHDLGFDADQLIELIRKYKNDDAVVVPALQVLTDIINNLEKGDKLKSIIAKVKGLGLLYMSEGSPERNKAFIDLSAALASKGAVERSEVDGLLNLYDAIAGAEGADKSVALLLTNFVKALAGNKALAPQVLERLAKIAEDHQKNPEVVAEVLKALNYIVSKNPLMATDVMNHTVLTNLPTETLSDPAVSDALLDLFEVLASIPGLVMVVSEKLEQLTSKNGALKEHPKFKRIFDLLSAGKKSVRTCKSIYEEISKLPKEQVNPSLQTDNVGVLISLMTKYNEKVMNKPDSPEAEDFAYGLRAFEIIAHNESNSHAVFDTDFSKVLISALSKQTDFNLLNSIIVTCCHICQYKSVAAKFIQPSGTNTVAVSKIISDCLSNLETSSLSNEIKEDFLINVLLLIAQTAINRKIYDKTSIITTAIKIWNDYDKKLYSKIRLMRQLFRTIRNIVNESHLEALNKEDIISRIKVLIDTCNDLYLLPDAFFLVGSMAALPNIKTQMGEKGLIQSLVNSQKNYIDGDVQSNALLTNCCLALANICIDFKPNSDLFSKVGGPDVNVKILTKFYKVPEIVNGASILLCNALYKNDTLKIHYGKIGAPAALTKCLLQFSGQYDKITLRCVEIILKSISNLSLYPKNLEYFLTCDSEKAFEQWMTKLNEIDNDLLKSESEERLFDVGFQTLSNLLGENTKESMEKFSVLINPAINILKTAKLSASSVTLLLDILLSLCRLPENTKKFSDEGIPLVISTLRRFDYDAELLSLGIHLLSLQAHTPEGTLLLLKSNLFDVLIGTLQVDPNDSDCLSIVISSLRCLRRTLTSHEIAYFYCGVGGISPLIDLTTKATTHPLLMVEIVKIFLGLLDLVESAENELFKGWKNIELQESDVNKLLQSILACSAYENSKRILSLQKVVLGICGYFSQAGLGYEAMASSSLDTLILEILQSSAGDNNMLEAVALVLYGFRNAPQEIILAVLPMNVRKAYKDIIKKLPNKKPAEKDFVNMLTAVIQAFETPIGDPPIKDEIPGCDFKFSLSGWNFDPYPNGVQDLPDAVKETLRNGDKCVIINEDLTRVNSKWKSSHNLICLEWGPENTEHLYRLPVLRVKNITKGLKNPILERAARRDSRKVNKNNCACIVGAPTLDFSDGVTIPLLFKGQKQRDEFVDLFIQWRDASSYNH